MAASVQGEWKRATALFLFTLSVSTVPVTVLAGIPFVLLMLFLPARRVTGLLVAAVVAFVATAGSVQASGMWYVERGWAVLAGGWFVALTLRWPSTRFLARGMAAVAGAAATGAVWFALRPGAWQVVDFGVQERMRRSVETTVEAMRVVRGGEAVTPALLVAVRATAEAQHLLFPALLGLATVAALGLAWWMYVRAGLGVQGALGSLRNFRFNDHLVWLFIGGLLLLVVGAGSGEVWSRTGSNAVVFMGGLYALRGMAVVLFVNGGISILGALTLALGMLFLAPILVAGALVIGLGDTWLDLRARFARSG
jgi:hypothetical protein